MKEWLWQTLTVRLVRANGVLQPHRAPAVEDYVKAIPIGRRYPGLGDCPIAVSEVTPGSERLRWPGTWILATVLWAKERFGLAQGYPEPWTSGPMPFPEAYVPLGGPPRPLPEFAAGGDPIAGVALRGPFSLMTRRVEGSDEFEVDLAHVEALVPRPGFARAGGRARLVRVAPGKLQTRWVNLDGARHTPADPDWGRFERRFLCGLNTHMTALEHLVRCHLLTAGTWALVTHAALPASHPLRILMQPFIVETMRVNNDNIDGLILSENSNVPQYTGYPLAAIDGAINLITKGFDIATADPEIRARRQGLEGDADFVTWQSILQLWTVFRTLADDWCRECLREVDLETKIWCKTLDEKVPNGVRGLLGLDDLDQIELRHVAHLVAVGAFSASVIHHVVADMTRDYMLAFDVMPPAVGEDGYPRRGMMLEKQNSITVAGIIRYRLLDDSIYTANATQKAVLDRFMAALRAIDREVAAAPDVRYRVLPSHVPSSIHA